ncbi:MAG TPA: helix-turn-helix domain-containing protein, partial [Dehalococcoidia bacterium]|nr:helix-turn-helix domain-containing protein [Dehalococcoidia bacterium]
MVALRSRDETGADAGAPPSPGPAPWPDPADWLSLQQAACELQLSPSTVRRMIRKGQLRNRIVPRRGGFRYLVYLPNSRHARMQALEPAAPPAVEPRRRLRLVDCAPAGPWRSDLAD